MLSRLHSAIELKVECKQEEETLIPTLPVSFQWEERF